MNTKTENILFEAWAYCDWKDKSTEFMIEYMIDVSGQDFDTVLDFIGTKGDKRAEWYQNNPDWTSKYEVKT